MDTTRPRDGSADLRPTTDHDNGLLGLAAWSSLGAGAIHAVAVGIHAEHRPASIAFALLAAAQVFWGAMALRRSDRLTALAGAVVSAAAVGGWMVAKTSGIGFIDGLQEAEKAQFPDTVCALLGAVALVLAARSVLLASLRSAPADALTGRTWNTIRIGATAIVAVTAVGGMVAAGNHQHEGGHSHGAAGHSHGAGGHVHKTVVPPKPYDPSDPSKVDLGGVPGVSEIQQARAEALIKRTLKDLPQFADYRVAEARGYRSIGDATTGDEHFIKWDSINDERFLDPNEPESLVYQPQPDGSRKLAAAMYMYSTKYTLDSVPDLGGKLTQWHIHDNLCFTKDPEQPVVAGITDGNGGCPPSLQKFEPAPMIHVWITKHPCGPFAALEGIGGGQIKAGEEKLCDQAHGSGL